MVERHHEQRVVRRECLEEEPLDRHARVADPLAVHAVADIEQQAEPDRDAIMRELGDGLWHAVFEDRERVSGEIGHEASPLVAHRHRDRGNLDAGAQRLRRARYGGGLCR